MTKQKITWTVTHMANRSGKLDYKILPRGQVEKLVLGFVEKHKLYAEYGRNDEGIFQVNFLVDEFEVVEDDG